MRTLKCPKCHEPMIVAEHGSVEIDSCAACGGVWLDGGELEALLGTAAPPKPHPDPDLGPPELDCPICVSKLVKDRYARTDVVVDKCPHGDGIWLDAGELEQVLTAYESAPASPDGHDEHAAGALKHFFGKPPSASVEKEKRGGMQNAKGKVQKAE